jgi:ribosomal-protein-alanine N-acetyltransferase
MSRIVPLRRCHLDQVVAIEQQAQPRPWTVGQFRAELEQPTRRYLVALSDDGRVLGYGGVLVAVDEAHVTTLGVDPAARRQGIASGLLRGLLAEAIARGATAATLEVRASNVAAQRLYGGFGFTPVGVRPRYYADSGEDAIIMWATDIDRADVADLAARPAALDARVGA